MSRKITIYDLAQMLNVSPATVSRSLNDHHSISDATKKRILEKAEEVGYRTNKFAANLSNQKSNTIGVIVPRLNSYFMSTVLAGIEQVANEVGYNLIISQSLESEEKEKINTRTLLDSGVDALLISLANDSKDYKHFEHFITHKIPILFFDRVIDLPHCPKILIDNLSAGYEAGKHLIEQGCANLLHISGNLKRKLYEDRYKGFKNALLEHQLEINDYTLIETDLDPKNIQSVIKIITGSPKKIDGIFVASDNYAANCIKELKKAGIRVPQDIKVVGFNNDPVSEIISPNLTTINYPGHKMGVLAGESIIAHLKGSINLQSTNTILLRHQLIIRESSSN
ncbi:LacI family DNA-binding transcriptional regulator [Maribacter confluentis]|uniref:LacI family DNA-binding transcriptional regulator n=1 Tax=Maribacter confluentis TaxID=1656093 RepID=A0ABT8RUU8_9FLAO|nr:LacI family DNA-binding transcriptional regulator [Maribacter confluentis]MDO1513856.1 LacI family DNA-binding transcriptional regulator [Maribacter confluentis]